ncbi:DNA primase [Fuchsiella alkaliacetigena]|uniref:DNA primase n=1 Tax=Fuchsiella alkaliacetigena TaxID=957042 RepID=UPI00200A2204|nr:DNA primase [Fuchsiella alkaliacetigena]MCK8824484.1 DNA primase [Fuchsiella alkaliacetigena]
MAYIDEDFIDQVRETNDIIDVVSEYLRLEKAGKNYKGLCPFHEEKTPSFTVTPTEQLYYCFGCGEGGNVFNFIMEIEGVEFPEAIRILAQRVGLDLPAGAGGLSEEERTKKSKLYEVHTLAAKLFNYLLLDTNLGEEAYNYLQNRGYQREILVQFKVGYAPDSWDNLLNFFKKRGYSPALLAEAGLIISRKQQNGYYDRFRNRLIFSIFSQRDQVIGFGGRVLDDSQPKYLNSPESLIFDKSEELYGLNFAKEEIKDSGEAIVVEGYTDVLTAHQAGLKKVVASLGTSLTKRQAKLLNRYAERVYIAYDGDVAGEKATLRGLNILKKVGLEVYIVDLPPAKDPDEVIGEQGKDYFESLLAEALTLTQFRIERLLAQRNSFKIEEKVGIVDELIPILADIENETELRLYISEVAKRVNVDIDTLWDRLRSYKHQNGGPERDINYRVGNNRDTSNTPTENGTNGIDAKNIYLKSAKYLLALMIKDQRTLQLVRELLTPADFIKEEYQLVAQLIFEFEEEEFKFDKALDQLDNPEAKRLLTQLSMSEVWMPDDLDYQQEITGYIKKIKEYQLQMEKERLETEIRNCEVNGEFGKASQLLSKYQQLKELENNIRKYEIEGDLDKVDQLLHNHRGLIGS